MNGRCAVMRTGALAALMLSLGRAATAQLSVTVTVDPAAERRTISPYIYGDNGQGGGHRPTARRQGGNRLSAYNWENNFSNAGNDYDYQSDSYLPWHLGVPSGQYRTPGIVLTAFHDTSLARGAYSLLTAPMIGWAARDGDGPCATWNGSQWVFDQRPPGSRWRQVVDIKGSAYQLTPDTSDGFVYSDEMVNFVLDRYGNAGAPAGVRGWSLDNEPDLWTSTHEEIRGDDLTYHELFVRSASLAAAITGLDPAAEVFGPASYGFNGYYNLQWAPDAGSYSSFQVNHAGFLNAYLDTMRTASLAAGRRLLHVLDVHWYPENDTIDWWSLRNGDTTRATAIDRMQRPRSLWDSTYLEPTWIGQWLAGAGQYPAVVLIPYLQRAVDSYYPGTKLAVTEYSFYADNHISGGIAQADFLGAAGTYGLYMANRWYGITGWAAAAFRLYRDYDGAGATYGDIAVRAQTSNAGSLPAYASILSSDSTKLHLLLINRNYDSAAAVTVTIQGPGTYDAGDVWYLGRGDSLLHHEILPAISGNSFVYSVPPLRACHLVLRNAAGVGSQPGGSFAARPFSLYPNPVRALAQLRFSRPGAYTVYNALGQRVAESDGTAPITAVVRAGVYFVRERGGGCKKLAVVR